MKTPRSVAVSACCLGLLTLALAACGEEAPPPPPPAPPPPAPPHPVVAPRTSAIAAAFDLVAVPGGAILVWGPPLERGGGLHGIRLDALGAARGRDVNLARGVSTDEGPGQVGEVVAASSNQQLGVVWVEHRGPRPQLHAVLSSVDLEAVGPVRDLGQSAMPVGSTRGRGHVLAGVTESGELFASYRLPDGPCRASSGTCARVGRARLGPEGEPVRGDGPLELIAPCDPLLVGSVTRGETWYQGLCHVGDASREEAEGPAITLYSIRPAISWAAATELGVGCVPLGVAPHPEGAIGVSRCGESIGAQRVDHMGAVQATVRAGERRSRCVEGRPLLEIAGPDGRVEVRLSDSASRLESLLPETMAPPGSRAVWTGESLLIAVLVGRDVTMRRYQCELDALLRSDI